MDTLPLVSTIVPTYNRYDMACQAIESVLGQTYTSIEIIVIDDGSSDNTQSLPKRFKSKIRYLYQPNAGLNAARNRAFQLARGKYIALLDDDDLWVPSKTEIQVACLEKYTSCAFVFSDFEIFNADKILNPQGLSSWFATPPDWPKLFAEHKHSTRRLPSGNGSDTTVYVGNLYRPLLSAPYVLPSTALFRRKIVHSRHPFPENNTHCGDWAFFAELSRRHDCIFLPEPMARNRSHSDPVRLTRKLASVKLYDRYDMIQRVWGTDPSFCLSHADAIRDEKSKIQRALLRALLSEGQTKRVRSETQKANKEGLEISRWEITFYYVLSFVPFLKHLRAIIRNSLKQLRKP